MLTFNRKEIKDHGEGGKAPPLKGRVVIIDDAGFCRHLSAGICEDY